MIRERTSRPWLAPRATTTMHRRHAGQGSDTTMAQRWSALCEMLAFNAIYSPPTVSYGPRGTRSRRTGRTVYRSMRTRRHTRARRRTADPMSSGRPHRGTMSSTHRVRRRAPHVRAARRTRHCRGCADSPPPCAPTAHCRCGQPALNPPSMGTVAPVTNGASSLSRNATRAAISAGWATRPVGFSPAPSRSASSETPNRPLNNGVSTFPVSRALICTRWSGARTVGRPGRTGRRLAPPASVRRHAGAVRS